MKNRGFSLMELVVVLVILALSTALVVPSLSRLSRTVEMKSAAKKVSGILRYYRSEAVNKGMVYQVLFDPESREVKVQLIDEEKEEVEGTGDKEPMKVFPLPQGVRFKEIKTTNPQFPSEVPAIEFYPSGGSNGGSVLMDREGDKGYWIKVHFLTGMVEVERG